MQNNKEIQYNMKLLLKNGNCHDVEKAELLRKDILIADGKIARMAEDIIPCPDCEVIDIKGKNLIPGFVDPHTHLGMVQEGFNLFLADYNEYYPSAYPALNAMDGIYHLDSAFDELRQFGTTTLCIAPGSKNVIGGRVVALKPYKNRIIDDMAVKNPIGLKCALGENPKRDSDRKNQHNSRMGNLYILRKTLYNAKEYMMKQEENNKYDMDLEVLCDVLRKKIPLRMHAHRCDDIISAIRIKQEFDIDLIIEHATEAHLIIPVLKKHDIPLILGPNLGARSKQETLKRNWNAPAMLKENGILFSFMTDYPVLSTYLLPYAAGIYLRYGLSFYDALRAITLNPARILGLDERIGSIKEGKDADILVYGGDPFHIGSMPEMVFIEGERVN